MIKSKIIFTIIFLFFITNVHSQIINNKEDSLDFTKYYKVKEKVILSENCDTQAIALINLSLNYLNYQYPDSLENEIEGFFVEMSAISGRYSYTKFVIKFRSLVEDSNFISSLDISKKIKVVKILLILTFEGNKFRKYYLNKAIEVINNDSIIENMLINKQLPNRNLSELEILQYSKDDLLKIYYHLVLRCSEERDLIIKIRNNINLVD